MAKAKNTEGAKAPAKAKPAKNAASADVQHSFELDGNKYNVLHGVIYGPEYTKLTPADICVNEEAQKALVASGSTALQEVFE